MGSAWYRMREGKEWALRQIILEKFKYLVALEGVHKDTNEKARGAYSFFKDLNEEEIREYAIAESKENRINLKKIKIYSLEPKLVKELKVNSK